MCYCPHFPLSRHRLTPKAPGKAPLLRSTAWLLQASYSPGFHTQRAQGKNTSFCRKQEHSSHQARRNPAEISNSRERSPSAHLLLHHVSSKCQCAAFGRARVHFFHSSWYGVTWICAGSSVDHGDGVCQGLFCLPARPTREWEQLGGDTAGPADPA